MDLKNKSILVTGADGFIGSHLVEKLLSLDCQVKAFVFYNSFNNLGWLESLSNDQLSRIKIFSGDIRDFNVVKKSMEGVDIVFHLAALIAIPYSYIAPESYIDTNIKGTLNVLQSAKENRCKKVMITSTSEVYGTAIYTPIDEKHPLIGQSPYSASKIAADQLAQSYYYSFNTPIKIVRPFNTYGPRQSARAIIPTVITQILAGAEKINVGNLAPTRDLTFVKDTCKGFVEIFKSDKLVGEVTNIGMNVEISIMALIELIVKIIGKDVEIKEESERIRPEKSEVERLWCNNSKIIEETNWTHDYTLETGLEETITWMKENLHLYKTHLYNV